MRLRHLLLAASVPLALAGCVSSSDIDGLRAQLAEIQRQVLQLQMQTSSKEEVAALQQNLRAQTDQLLKAEADRRADFGNLSSQISALQGQLEDTNYRLAQVSQQIASTNQDLKAVRSATTPPPVAGAPGATGPVSDPETLYQTAYSDYLRGNYDLALLGFRQYLESFPETDLADNASYWIGECFYRQQKFAEAIAQYDEVLSRWPRSDKTASSQLKKGYAQIELGRRDDGIRQLQAVARDFPNSDEANLARQRLQSLGVATGQKRQ
ncbi:MAG: Tetratricopeptide repeat protein [Acidobacteria bacterium]|nr:Tetratricopeptide repeat protein [Acidobacteriota bacterium]